MYFQTDNVRGFLKVKNHERNNYIQCKNFTLVVIVLHFSHTKVYTDRDGRLKTKSQLYTVCGANPINNQIRFFNGHGIVLDDHTLCFMEYQTYNHSS